MGQVEKHKIRRKKKLRHKFPDPTTGSSPSGLSRPSGMIRWETWTESERESQWTTRRCPPSKIMCGRDVGFFQGEEPALSGGWTTRQPAPDGDRRKKKKKEAKKAHVPRDTPHHQLGPTPTSISMQLASSREASCRSSQRVRSKVSRSTISVPTHSFLPGTETSISGEPTLPTRRRN